MYVPCILSATTVMTWFKSMRTLFSCLKKKTSGQAAKALTARQKWAMANFQFLSAHLCIRADDSQLDRVHTPVLQVDPERRMREETMKMPPMPPPARHPVSCPARPRPAPVNLHLTGGLPGQHPVGLGSE